MNITKKASALTALVLAGSLLFTGCGKAEEAPATNTAPVAEATAEAPAEEVVETPANPFDSLMPNQQAAFAKAEQYLQLKGFSKAGLVDQLVFENFAAEDAQAAVDILDVDWNNEAVRTAAAYVAITSFSYQGLVDQLIFEKFSPEEAAIGASSTGLTP